MNISQHCQRSHYFVVKVILFDTVFVVVIASLEFFSGVWLSDSTVKLNQTASFETISIVDDDVFFSRVCVHALSHSNSFLLILLRPFDAKMFYIFTAFIWPFHDFHFVDHCLIRLNVFFFSCAQNRYFFYFSLLAHTFDGTLLTTYKRKCWWLFSLLSPKYFPFEHALNAMAHIHACRDWRTRERTFWFSTVGICHYFDWTIAAPEERKKKKMRNREPIYWNPVVYWISIVIFFFSLFFDMNTFWIVFILLLEWSEPLAQSTK